MAWEMHFNIGFVDVEGAEMCLEPVTQEEREDRIRKATFWQLENQQDDQDAKMPICILFVSQELGVPAQMSWNLGEGNSETDAKRKSAGKRNQKELSSIHDVSGFHGAWD